MGDIADAMLDGDLCAGCGSFIDMEGGNGFPRFCSPACGPSAPKPSRKERKAARSLGFVVRHLRKRDVRWLALAAGDGGCAVDKCATAFLRLEKLGYAHIKFAGDPFRALAFITEAGVEALRRAAGS